MEFWSSAPNKEQRVKTKKGDKKTQESETTLKRMELVLAAGGSLDSAHLKLDSRTGRLEWDFVKKSALQLRIVSPGYQLFPNTRPKPTSTSPLNARKRADQASRFLQAHYPDVDIPVEILREEIRLNDLALKEQATRAHISNRLAIVHTHEEQTFHRRGFLCYPAGALGNELNVSPLTYSRKKRTTSFTPSLKPAYAFELPIQQLVASTANVDDWHDLKELPSVGVRTDSFVSVLTVGKRDRLVPTPLVSEALRIRTSELQSRPTDISMSTWSLVDAFTIAKNGIVMHMTWKEGRGRSSVVQSPRSVDSDNRIMKVACTKDINSLIWASDRQLQCLDIRALDAGKETYSLPIGEVITSIEGSGLTPDADEHLMTICTTKRVLWMDDRFIGRPVISWEHKRAIDYTLEAKTCYLAAQPITFLTSYSNGLVTLYNVSRANSGQLPHAYGNQDTIRTVPYDYSRAGSAFYRHPAAPTSTFQDFNFIELNDQSGVTTTLILQEDLPNSGFAENLPRELDMNAVGNKERRRVAGIERNWSLDVEKLDAQAEEGLMEDFGKFGEREKILVDFTPLQKELSKALEDQENSPSREMIEESLQRMPELWQSAEYPLQTLMTPLDIAYHSTTQPDTNRRGSTFTSNTIFNSSEGRKAFRYDLLPSRETLGKDAAWSWNMRDSIKAIYGEAFDIPTERGPLMDYLTSATNTPKTEEERAILETIAVDLALSMDVYSADGFASTRKSSVHEGNTPVAAQEDEALEKATQALTLGEKKPPPPPVKLSFFKPKYKTKVDFDADVDMDNNDEVEEHLEGNDELRSASEGLKLLLSDWEIGADPKNYEFRDIWGQESDSGSEASEGRNPVGNRGGGSQSVGRSQIPTIASSQIPPIISSQIPSIAATQSRLAAAVIAASTPRRASPIPQLRRENTLPALQSSMSQVVTGFTRDIASSSSQVLPMQETQSQSQDLFTSTQVLPGKFGGRSEGKVKKTKKRAAGF